MKQYEPPPLNKIEIFPPSPLRFFVFEFLPPRTPPVTLEYVQCLPCISPPATTYPFLPPNSSFRSFCLFRRPCLGLLGFRMAKTFAMGVHTFALLNLSLLHSFLPAPAGLLQTPPPVLRAVPGFRLRRASEGCLELLTSLAIFARSLSLFLFFFFFNDCELRRNSFPTEGAQSPVGCCIAHRTKDSTTLPQCLPSSWNLFPPFFPRFQ